MTWCLLSHLTVIRTWALTKPSIYLVSFMEFILNLEASS